MTFLNLHRNSEYKTAIIIPSRIGSTRLAKKPLEMIGEFTMIEHVVHKALLSKSGDVFVATDSQEIANKALVAGAQAIITKDVETGTDRVWEAVLQIPKYDYIINLQGDLPLVAPHIITNLVALLQQTKCDIVTPVTKENRDLINNDSKVKVIIDEYNKALYFSRNMIPYKSNWYWHHIGIYGFQYEALKKFVSLPQTHNELSENLEQLRALDNNMTIEALIVDENVLSVDTAEDLENVRQLYKKLAN